MSIEIPHQRRDLDALSARAVAILDFEREWWTYAGAKDAAVRARFGLTRDEYDLELAGVLDQPQAMAYDEQTVTRLALRRRSSS